MNNQNRSKLDLTQLIWIKCISLPKKVSDECKFDMNKAEYQREFNYCFNCGRRIDPSTTYDNEGYCCISFRTSQENGAIEVLKHNSKQEFLLNLLPRSQSTEFLNSGCSKVVEQAGLNWCPFCGINLEEEIPKG